MAHKGEKHHGKLDGGHDGKHGQGVAKHGHEQGNKHGIVPHAGHGLHPDHKMLHHDHFHLNKHHG